MKIGGQSIQLQPRFHAELATTDEDGQPTTIRIECDGMPLAFETIKAKLFPVPASPKRMVTNASGGVLRDKKNGNQPLWELDEAPGPLTDRINLAQRNQLLLMTYVATRRAITWESMDGYDWDSDDPQEFAKRVDAMHDEAETAGFKIGHLLKIQKAALAATGITDEQMDDARDSFT